MKDYGIYQRIPNIVGTRPYNGVVKILPRAKRKNPSLESQHIVYHSYSYASNGNISEKSSYKLRQFTFINTEIDFTLEYDYKTRQLSTVKERSTLNLVYDPMHYGKYTTKSLGGYADLSGTLYEKDDETLYDINTIVELYDKDTKYKFTEIPVVNGKFSLNKINVNDYTLKIIDSVGKYTPKEINVSVVDINEDHIEPYIILLSNKQNLYDYNERFIQKIVVGDCLSTNNSLSVDNKPTWLSLSKIGDNIYELSGIPPIEVYDQDFELKFNLYDYRITGIKETSKIKKYNIKKQFTMKNFNSTSFNDTDLTFIGNDVTVSNYNGMDGLKVNGKTNTFTMKNLVTSTTNGDFTIMYVFTILKFDNKETKHNLFLGNVATASAGTFWLGTPPTNTRLEPPLTLSMNQAKSTQLNVFMEENRTYFVKIVRNNGVTKVFVNNRVAISFNDNDILGIKTLPFMFGDGGWGNYKSNILVHEYNFINDYGDVSNKIRFKSSEEEIDSYLYRNTYHFKFSTLAYFDNEFITTNEFERDYSYIDGLKNNGLKYGIDIRKKLKTFTISFELMLDNDYKCTILEMGDLKIHYLNKEVIFTYKNVDLYKVKIAIDQKVNFDMAYNKKGKLTVYFMGSKHGSVTYENIEIGERFIYIGMNKYKDEDSFIRGNVYSILITEGLLYSGDHIYTGYTDINIEKYETRKYKMLYQFGYKSNINESSEIYNDSVVSLDNIILSNNRDDIKPVLVDGVKHKYIDGKQCFYFTKETDRIVLQADILKYVPQFDITFDFYWSGKRTSSAKETIISSNNSVDGTSWANGLFTLRANGTGTIPPLYGGFSGVFGGTTSYSLKVGWNTIRFYRGSVLGYYIYCTINGQNTNIAGGSYSSLSLGGTDGFLCFGYNTYDKSGLIDCAIANLNIKITYE